MNKRIALALLVGLAALLAVGMNLPATAAPAPQYTYVPTPTPGPDGRIIFIVTDESPWTIAARFNIPIEELRQLNMWGDNPITRPGDEILLGYAGPAEVTPTPGPTAISEPALPTPTSEPGWGIICILLYNDLNGDSFRQEEEPSIPGGAISINNRSGTVSITESTVAGLDYQCFEQLLEGTYTVSVAVPDGYNATTQTNRSVSLAAGDITYLGFAAHASSTTNAQAAPAETGGRSPLLGIIGGIFLLSALGLTIFAGRLLKTKS
ncbi:MAG: SdrD B-like domain-containing protein [Anaerolineales bacterium]